jgi:hypothetical protein
MKKEDPLAFARNMVAIHRPPFARGKWHRWPKDGVYQVRSHPHNGGKPFCAGFVIKNGRVTRCAPILRSRILFWVHRGVFVCEV